MQAIHQVKSSKKLLPMNKFTIIESQLTIMAPKTATTNLSKFKSFMNIGKRKFRIFQKAGNLPGMHMFNALAVKNDSMSNK